MTDIRPFKIAIPESALTDLSARLALTLRYLDGLSIPEMARELGRSRHATEALVVRARAAFRNAYEGEEGR